MSNLQYKVFTDEIMDDFFKSTGYRDLIVRISKDKETADYYLQELKTLFKGKIVNTNNRQVFFDFIIETIAYMYQELQNADYKKRAKRSSYLRKSKKEQLEWIQNKAKDFGEFLSILGLNDFEYNEMFDLQAVAKLLAYMIEKPEKFVQKPLKLYTKAKLTSTLSKIAPPPSKRDIDEFLTVSFDSVINKSHNFIDLLFDFTITFDNVLDSFHTKILAGNTSH